MSLIEPDNNDYIGEQYRNKVIKALPMVKQFTVQQHLRNTDNLSREQAIDLLKDCIVQLAQKDALFIELMKDNM